MSKATVKFYIICLFIKLILETIEQIIEQVLKKKHKNSILSELWCINLSYNNLVLHVFSVNDQCSIVHACQKK